MSYPPNFNPPKGHYHQDPRHNAAGAWVPEAHPHHSSHISGSLYPVYPTQPNPGPFQPEQYPPQQAFGSPVPPYNAAYGQQQPSFDQPGHLYGDHLSPYPIPGVTQSFPPQQGSPYSAASTPAYGFNPGQQYSPSPASLNLPVQKAPLPHSPAPSAPLSGRPGSAISEPVAPEALPAPTPSKPLKIKLRVSRQPESAPELPAQTDVMSRRPSSSAVGAAAQYQSYSSGRPTRAAQAKANYRIQQMDDDAPSDQDAEGEDEADEVVEGYDGHDNGYTQAQDEPYDDRQASKSARLHALQEARRSQRERKQPERLVESDVYDTHAASRSSSRRQSHRNEDVEGDDGQYVERGEQEAYQPPRNAFPTRTTRSTRASEPQEPVTDAGLALFNDDSDDYREAKPQRNPKKSKKRAAASQRSGYGRSDAEDSFEPSEDGGSDEDADSEDPINGYEVDDDDADRDEDDFIVASSPPTRRTRNSRSQRGPTRRSTRAAAHHDTEDESPSAKRPNLRAKKAVNYALPPADISTELTSATVNDAIAGVSKPNGRARGAAGPSRFGTKTFSFNLGGRDIAQAMGEPDSSDSDDMLPPIRAGAGGQTAGPGGPKITAPTDVPNFGRINPKSSTADADPLGVDMNVTFDRVGGLDDHINQLKEMVALPLLYPELFQQFGITPPRGVLFHGPPGTGKTLLARALAASCSTGNTKISFFMRKGADVLSKWVGEAERQLRMLFEEARAVQPSIIFFDEIDGLAPVRSSKQDQIHASLVSTLLALMDGMDGRGQVIVIGATNRPDAVDPALRRPGRFDREFYFPLPNLDARKRIIEINTRKWDPPLEPAVVDQLGRLTKGYGGADLRALCTEAALNAIQRRYPQIYRSSDRFALNTKSIHVSTKDFMMSIKKIVPSSARSTSSAAMQLPPHLVPLLAEPLDRIKTAIEKVMPRQKLPTALEEAQWEDEGDDFQKHMMLQALDKLRTHRPRVLISGPRGMGQNHLGPAVLHHLEGYHVQSFDLGTLLGDSARTVEAALIQLFVEARRHQPSIIYLPSLAIWSHTISDSARSTFNALLEGIPPSDPILVLGMAEDEDVKEDVWAWFDSDEGRVDLALPAEGERVQYFAEFLQQLQLSPADLPDAVERRKRVLEELPLAAPLPPRQQTEAELQREYERDNNARQMVVLSFSAFVGEMAKKYKRVVAGIREDAMILSNLLRQQAELDAAPPITLVGEDAIMGDGLITAPQANAAQAEAAPTVTDPAGALAQALPPPTAMLDPLVAESAPAAAVTDALPAAPSAQAGPSVWQANPVDLDVIQRKIARHKYFTPDDFLHDISLIEENAVKVGDPDRLARVTEMAAMCRLHVSGFDPKWTPEFAAYKERMLARKAARQKKKQEEEEAAAAAAAGAASDTAQAADSTDAAQPNGAAGGSTTIDGTPQVVSAGELSAAKRPRDEDVDMDRDGKRPRENGPESDIIHVRDPNSADESATIDAATVPPPKTAPPPVYPPFVVSALAVSVLGRALGTETSGLNVDQLEQLRAGLYSRLWRGRKEWDRTGLLNELLQYVRSYVSNASA